MNNSKLLEGKTFIDFTHRLPGPLAGRLLSKLGAKVIKVEDEKFQDAFLKGLFPSIDESFASWYKDLNVDKEILRIDFKNSDSIVKVSSLIEKADGILMGPPPKVRHFLQITDEDLKKQKRPLAVIEQVASHSHTRSMHDLNALAESGLLKLHIAHEKGERIAPPFLPISGMALGPKTALDLLALVLKSREENKVLFHQTALDESTLDIFQPAWPLELKEKEEYLFLHNGKYPCYNIYRTQDKQYVALAAVEEKFWDIFCETFHLSLPAEQRFHQEEKIFKQISLAIQKFTFKEIQELIEGKDMCLSLII